MQPDVYLFGQILGTHSFLLRDGFLKPDEYAEIEAKYFLPGGSYRLTCRAPLVDVLRELLTVSQDPRIRDGAETLLDMAAEGGAEEDA